MKKLLLPLLLIACVLVACSEQPATPAESMNIQGLVSSSESGATKHDVSQFEAFKLQEVIDGDTIRIQYKGASEKVRFLLVDTPETKHETLGEQPFGPEAKQFIQELLKGEDTVYVEFDVSYRDKYKRLLGYIYTKDGISLQEELLRNGLARVAYIYDPNTKHVDWFKSVQKTAQKAAIGIWSVEDYVTNRGYDKEAYKKALEHGDIVAPAEETTQTPAPDQQQQVPPVNNDEATNDACDVKGNINAKGNKIYHMPGQRNYDQTIAEEMFCSAEEAEAAGFVAAKN